MVVPNVLHIVYQCSVPVAIFTDKAKAEAWADTSETVVYASLPVNPPPRKQYWRVEFDIRNQPHWAAVSTPTKGDGTKTPCVSATGYGTCMWWVEASDGETAIRMCKGYMTDFIQRG